MYPCFYLGPPIIPPLNPLNNFAIVGTSSGKDSLGKKEK